MALKNNTWKINQWYDQAVAGNVSYSSTLNNLYIWGGNGNEALWAAGVAGGEPARRSSPVQIPGSTWKDFSNVPGKATGTIVASKTDGTLWVLGRGATGELAQNNRTWQSSPVQVSGTTWGTTYDTMSMGYQNVMNIRTDGTLWAWGSNTYGQCLQNNVTPGYSSPVQVPGTWSMARWTIGAGYGIRTDGTLWSWGYNAAGALGLNQASAFPATKYSSPVQIPGTTWTTKLSTGERNVWAIKTDGTLWCWGNNGDGQLGLNNKTQYSSPVQMSASTDWSSVHPTLQGGFALKTDGTLWAWGNNTTGTCGQNSTSVARYSSPVQIPGTTWSVVRVAANYKVKAIKTDGTLWTWGSNDKGQLGVNNITHYSSPTQLGSESDWSKIGGSSSYQGLGLRAL